MFANAQSGNVILFGIGLAEPRLASSFAHLWPPANAPQWTITTSIGLTSALQMSWFRTVRSSAFVPIAMTGNLMRVTEALGDVWAGVAHSQTVTILYAALIATFTGGAVLGALLTIHLHTTAALIPAGLFVLASALMTVRMRSEPV